MTQEKDGLSIRNFPAALRREIKAAAAKEGKTIGEYVIETLRKAIV